MDGCQAYYRESSYEIVVPDGTAVARIVDGRWVALPSCTRGLEKAVQDLITTLPACDDPSYLVSLINARVFTDLEIIDQTVRNAYISIEIDQVEIEEIQKSISSKLHSKGIHHELISRAHISVAYILGDYSLKKLTKIADRIASSGFQTEIIGVEILEGAASEFDYVALTLSSKGDTEYVPGIISSECELREFEGGFKFHVSIMMIPRGVLNAHSRDRLKREIDIPAMNVTTKARLTGDSVNIFSEHREVLSMQKFGSISRRL